MMDAFTKVVAQADAKGEYLSGVTLDALSAMVSEGNKRMDVVNRVTKDAHKMVVETFRAWLLIEFTTNDLVSDDTELCCKLEIFLDDLDLILRYVSYATVAGDVGILEDCNLYKVRENWLAQQSASFSVGQAIQIMKRMVIGIISAPTDITPGDYSCIIAEVATYFDYIIGLVNGSSTGNAHYAIQELQQLRETKVESDEARFYIWECDNYTEWVERDVLNRMLLKYGVEDLIIFEKSSLRLFTSWKMLPMQAKKDVWREREVLAALYEQMMEHWKNIPDFRSIAVAERVVDGRHRLAGILVFNFAVGNENYKIWNIPPYIRVPSLVPSVVREDELVPIQLEWMSKNTQFSKEVIASPSVDFSLSPVAPYFVQSGDIIVGCNDSGRLNGNHAVTLTTFVTPQSSSSSSEVRLLTVGHGFTCGYTNIYTCEQVPPAKIGEISYDSPVQEELAKKVDASLIRPIDSLPINLSARWANTALKSPVEIARRGMLVQMYGGTSKHQTGYIDYSGMLEFGPVSSAVPYFTAIINAKPGDSGALLVTGHGTYGDPELNGKEKGYSEAYLDSRRFAMLGMLVEGSVQGTFQSTVIFRPMDIVFLYLKVKPWLPDTSMSNP
jgi:phycocyanin beta chain